MSPRLSLLSLLLATSSLVAGITNVTSIQTGSTTTCSSYPHWDPSTDTTGGFYFTISSATNSSLNGLRDSINTATSPQTIDITPNSDVAIPLFACAKGVVSNFFVTPAPSSIYFSGIEDNQQLVYADSGALLETYSVEVDGVALDGTYLGLGNVTTWGFTFAPGPGGAGSVDSYAMRLLGAATTLGEGEVEGFLSVVGK
jgi:hypothetical protein